MLGSASWRCLGTVGWGSEGRGQWARRGGPGLDWLTLEVFSERSDSDSAISARGKPELSHTAVLTIRSPLFAHQLHALQLQRHRGKAPSRQHVPAHRPLPAQQLPSAQRAIAPQQRQGPEQQPPDAHHARHQHEPRHRGGRHQRLSLAAPLGVTAPLGSRCFRASGSRGRLLCSEAAVLTPASEPAFSRLQSLSTRLPASLGPLCR